MRAPRLFAFPIAAATLALAGCSTTRPVEVTRFHLAGPIAPGSFVVQPGVPATQAAPQLLQGPIETQGYESIVAGELQRLGFTPAPAIGRADLVATVTVDRGTRPDLTPHGSSVSLGLGGFGGGGGWRGGSSVGGGAGVTLPVGGNNQRYITGTRLMVQLKRRSEGTVIWEGRAQTEAKANDPSASPDAAVARLAHALFAGFPGDSGRTITVK